MSDMFDPAWLMCIFTFKLCNMLDKCRTQVADIPRGSLRKQVIPFLLVLFAFVDWQCCVQKQHGGRQI